MKQSKGKRVREETRNKKIIGAMRWKKEREETRNKDSLKRSKRRDTERKKEKKESLEQSKNKVDNSTIGADIYVISKVCYV